MSAQGMEPTDIPDMQITEGQDTYRFHLDKRVMRVRFENETENGVVVVIEPCVPATRTISVEE